MTTHPYLTRRGKCGLLSFRRSVPKSLQPLVGAREIVVAFGTSDLSIALKDYHVAAARAEARLARAKQNLADGARLHTAGGSASAGPDLAALSARVRAQRHILDLKWQAEEREFRADVSRRAHADPEGFLRGERPDLPRPSMPPEGGGRDPLSSVLDATFRRRLEHLLTESYAARLGLLNGAAAVNPGHAAESESAPVLSARIAAPEAMLGDGSALKTSAFAIIPESVLGHKALHQGPLFSVASREWLDAERSRWGRDRELKAKTIMEDFLQVAGDKPIGSYRRSDGRAFFDLLQQLPANLVQRRHLLGVSGRDLQKVAEAAQAKGFQRQDAKTVNVKMGLLSQCFEWLKSRYDEVRENPVQGFKARVARSPKDEKDAFSGRELSLMFTAPVYTGCEFEARWSRPGSTILRASPKFWLPLLGLFTGMRLGEICKLRRSHVRLHNGVWYLAVIGDLKTASSVRSVPLHQTLLDLGFLTFTRQSDEWLFPELAGPSGVDTFSKHFSRFLTAVGIKRRGLDFQSLRHTFVSAATAWGIEYSVRERLIGHALQGQAGRYGKRYADEQRDMDIMLTRNAQLQRLRFADLDVSHLIAGESSEPTESQGLAIPEQQANPAS